MEDVHNQAESDYMSGMKYKDIADKYNVSLNTVKSWKKRYDWNRGAPSKKKVCEEGAHKEDDISWIDIEHEYVTDIRKKSINLKELSEKYSIDYEYLRQYASDHKWRDKKNNYITETSQNAIAKSSEIDAKRIARLLNIADSAADKAEQALKELDQYVVYNKHKTKETEYKEPTALGKPTKETVHEITEVATSVGPIDRMGLSQVTSALKNLKDLYVVPLSMNQTEFKNDVDKRKLELEVTRMEIQQKETQEPEQQVQDNFLDALNASAQEVWKDGE